MILLFTPSVPLGQYVSFLVQELRKRKGGLMCKLESIFVPQAPKCNRIFS